MKIRKKAGIIVGFYIISFIVAFVLANYMFNYDRTHVSKNQGDTTLIRLYVKNSNMQINEMDAYVDEMDASYLRLSVTPVSDTKKLTLQMYEPEKSVRKITYELMDDTNTKLLEAGECSEIQRVEGEREAELRFTSDLTEGQEYCLNLMVEDDAGSSYHYYTRLLYGTNFQVYDKLKFVLDFHTATFSKTAITRLAEYLSYYEDADSSNFRNISIYSDSDAVTWGKLSPEQVGDVDITLLNLDSQTAEIELVYEIQASDDGGNDYNYMVTETFEVSATGSQVNLIGYTRTMDEKLDEQSFYFSNSDLRLGIVDDKHLDIQVYGKQKPEVEESEAEETENANENEEYNTYISFAADGALWVYNTTDNVLTQAFGFEHKNQTSYREKSYLKHDVKVLRTEDNGNLLFAVYGYMYNGDREGKFGIQINTYDRVAGTHSEVVFIPYDKNYELLEAGIRKMGFVDDNSRLYLYLEDEIYQIDTVTKEVQVLLSGADSEDCVISDDGKSIVMPHYDDNGRVTEIEWANLETGDIQKISARNQKLQVIGILSNNLVYGVADLDASSGRMDAVYIVDFKRNVLKEYTVDGGYINDAEIKEGNVVQIWRRKNDHTDMESDYIIYNEQKSHNVEAYSSYQQERMYETWLTTEAYGNDEPIVMFARAIEAYRNTDMAFETEGERYTGYYVEVNGERLKCATFKEAFVTAYENDSKVLDYQGRLVLRPAVRADEKSLNGPGVTAVGDNANEQQREVLEWLLTFEKKKGEAVLDSDSMLENLKATFPDYTCVNMSGIPLQRALTMISYGYPLIVKNSEGTWCVCEGYGTTYIEIADPNDGTVVRYDWDSAVEGIASSGNIIYSYIR